MVKWLAGPGKYRDVFGSKPLGTRKNRSQFVSEIDRIASTLRGNCGDSVARCLAGAKRVLILIDDHSPLGVRFLSSASEHRLGHDAHGQGSDRGTLQKRASGPYRHGR